MRAAPSREREDVTVAHGRAVARSRDTQSLAREQRPLVLYRAVAFARRAVSSAAPSAERVELAIAADQGVVIARLVQPCALNPVVAANIVPQHRLARLCACGVRAIAAASDEVQARRAPPRAEDLY